MRSTFSASIRRGCFCLDVGSSTGGFTDVLLARGARHVVAVDVGHDQLHEKLRRDPRVTSLEGQDARTLTRAQLAEAPALIVMDASFISLGALLPNVLSLAAPQRDPCRADQAAVRGRTRAANKKGVVRDDKVHADVCAKARADIEALGWRVADVIASPIEGGDGNREFLICAARGADI